MKGRQMLCNLTWRGPPADDYLVKREIYKTYLCNKCQSNISLAVRRNCSFSPSHIYSIYLLTSRNKAVKGRKKWKFKTISENNGQTLNGVH